MFFQSCGKGRSASDDFDFFGESIPECGEEMEWVAGKCFCTGKGDINFLVVSELSVVFVESSFCIQGPGLLEGGR